MPHMAQYLGVAGVTTPWAAADSKLYLPDGPLTAVGVLAGLDSLEGRGAHNPKRYPAREDWRDIFGAVRADALGILHYTGPNDETLPAQLAGAMHWAGDFCDGIQFNIAWPAPEVLRGFRRSYPEKEVILQLSAKALRMAGDDPAFVALAVAWYVDSIDNILLDSSGGTGKPLTAEFALPYLDALRHRYGNFIGLGVAGGFGPHDSRPVDALLKKYPDLSFDAESKLRDEDDELDVIRANNYLTRFQRMVHAAHARRSV